MKMYLVHAHDSKAARERGRVLRWQYLVLAKSELDAISIAFDRAREVCEDVGIESTFAWELNDVEQLPLRRLGT